VRVGGTPCAEIGSLNHYELLGVHHEASLSIIHAAYKAKMKIYHPDVVGGRQSFAAADLNAAFSTLKDPEKRRLYDLELRPKRERRHQVPPPSGRISVLKYPARGRAAGLLLLIVSMAVGIHFGPEAFRGARNEARVRLLRAAAAGDPAAGAILGSPQPPVDPEGIGRAVEDFDVGHSVSGMAGAATLSRQCYKQLKVAGEFHLLDRCLAIDLAAGLWGTPPPSQIDYDENYFGARNRTRRYESAIRSLGGEPNTGFGRDRQVERATLSAMSRHVARQTREYRARRESAY